MRKIDRKTAYKIAVVLVIGLFAVISIALPSIAEALLGEGNTKVSVNDSGDGYIYWQEDGTEYMRLTGGKLGIGTTTPGNYKVRINSHQGLFVYGEEAIYGNTAWGKYAVKGKACNSYGVDGYGIYGEAIGGLGDGTAYAIYGDQNTGDYAGYFDGKVAIMNGNIGIGTTDPKCKLDIWDDRIRIRTYRNVQSTSGGYTGEISWSHSNSRLYICTYGDGPGGIDDTWKYVDLSDL